MAVKLVFLGKLADLAGNEERDVDGPVNWQVLLSSCASELAEALNSDRIRVAVNGEVLADKAALAAVDGDEVALLPPVSGG